MSKLHELSHGEMVARIKAAEQERDQLHIALRDEVYDRLAAEARVEAAEGILRAIQSWETSHEDNSLPSFIVARIDAALACPPQRVPVSIDAMLGAGVRDGAVSPGAVAACPPQQRGE